MAKRRNFSPWAYWRLHLDAIGDADPPPADDAYLVAWRGRAYSRLHALLGRDPAPVPLDLETTDEADVDSEADGDGDGYTRARIVFDVEPAMSVPAYLLVPKGRRAPGPAVLAIHGHGPGKDAICAVDGGDPQRRARNDEAGGAYAHELAGRGYVVLAPDLRCFGERSDPSWEEPGKYECDWNLVAATMAARNPLTQNLYDMRRAIDVLVAHPLVDADRIAVCGLSYGATVSLFLAAIDARVRAAVVSGYLSSWRAAHTVPWNMCGSQILPGMLGALEHVHIAALVAPRPLLVESGTGDLIFPVASARETVAQLARVYRVLGAPPDALVHDVFEGGHQWHGDAAYDFLAHHV